ncbi:MAG TPA: MerR family transcriptional regulator [Herpetosiphonaceae bacterium]
MSKIDQRFQQFSAAPVYNTKAVVQRTGVPADTLRAWERRYGVPNPRRTEGRHRSYSDRDVALISWLREQTDAGLSISQAVALLESDVPVSFPFIHAASKAASLAELRRQCAAALLDFDSVRADAALTEALGIYPLETVCLELLQPMLTEAGHGWRAGSVSIAQEHATSAFVRSKVAAFYGAAITNSNRGALLLACGPGERHDIGLLMLALFLSRRGWRIAYLGADVPGDEVIRATLQLAPRLVALSANQAETRAACEPILHELAALSVLSGYGGAAFLDPAARSDFPGTYLGDNALLACSTIETLLS